jgi:hypothetical protein
MSKLTPLAKILIGLVLLVMFFIVVKILIIDKEVSPVAVTKPSETKTPVDTVEAAPAQKPQQVSKESFSYSPPEPVNGKLKGVIELGATSLSSFIIRIDEQKRWELEKADYGSSLLYEEGISSNEVNARMRDYISGMYAFGVPPKDIHFVVSSGALEATPTKKIIDELKKIPYKVNTVSVEEESELAAKCVLPLSYQNNAFVVDIGSGTTKVAWMQDGKIIPKGIKLGAKYFSKNIDDKAAYQQTLEMAKAVPKNNAVTCFIIGGIPFELAKQVRNDKERYTIIKMPDEYTPEGEKQKAGLNLYKAIADATGCKKFVFDWEANFTIGFLLTLNY